MKDLRIAVTGVASGIGAETAKLLRARGAHVLGLDIQPPVDGGGDWRPIDLGDPASIDAAVAAIDGPFDGLCNIAGLPPRDGNQGALLGVNVQGLRRFTLGLAPKLLDGAAIVNLASKAGVAWADNIDQVKALLDLPDGADLQAFCDGLNMDGARAYRLSKEAVIVWTMMAQRQWMGRGIRVNSVSPSAVSTPILDDFERAFGPETLRKRERAGRPGKPGEIAEIVAFLCSPQSNWIKGTDVPCDGGVAACLTVEALGLAP